MYTPDFMKINYFLLTYAGGLDNQGWYTKAYRMLLLSSLNLRS